MNSLEEEAFRDLFKVTRVFHTTLFRLVEVNDRDKRQARLDKLAKEFTTYGNLLRKYGYLDPSSQ